MSTETWGLMPKNQDDPTKIEERMTEMITEHNEDPDAHLGAGKSLETHKTNETIDHPAGSLLADKKTFSELEFNTTFENVGAYYTLGSVSELWPGFMLEPTGTLYANRGELQIDGESGNIEIDFAKEQLFQFIFSADIASDGEVYLQMGQTSNSTFKRGFGLQIIGTTATFYASNSAGTSFDTLSFPTFTALNTYIIRMHYVPDDELIYVYIDGELLGTLEWPDTPPTGYFVCRFLSIRPTTSSPVLNVKSLYVKVTQ